MTSGIHGIDNRQVIRKTNPLFEQEPLPAVTAIDLIYNVTQGLLDGYGSGIVIAPNYVLTAAHNLYQPSTTSITPIAIRVTTSAVQETLNSRVIGSDPSSGTNVDLATGLNFLANYNIQRRKRNDIALLKTNNNLLDSFDIPGLITFINPQDAISFFIQTAGYPGDNIPGVSSSTHPGISGHTGRQPILLV